MWPLLTGLISGGASLLGSVFSSQQSAQNQQAQIAANEQMQTQSEQFNAEQADITRSYQSQMSNTAYQRASKDMVAAGLNPAAMFGSGGAAGTPSGATASVGVGSSSIPGRTSVGSQVGDAVGKVVSSAIAAKTYDKMTEEIANLQAEQAKLAAVTDLTKQTTATERHETQKREEEVMLTRLREPGARVSAREATSVENLPGWLRDIAAQGGYLGRKGSATIEPITDLVSSATGAGRLFKDIWRDRVDRGY